MRLSLTFPEQLRPATKTKAQAADLNNQTILIGLMMPLMMLLLNFSMFGVALPAIRDTFGIQADMSAWLVTVYTLPFVIFMPLYGRLGDGLGKRQLFLIGIAIFLVGTTITLLAPNLRLLLLGRAIQGIGSAGITPLSIAVISELFPANERGQALGTWHSVGPLTSMAGPFLAGFLIDSWGWSAIFGLILLAGLMALFVVREQVPASQSKAEPGFLRSFDWGGVVLLGAATTMLVFYTSSRPITGVDALRDWRLLSLTLLFFGGFILWEKRQAAPFVDLSLFGHINFSRASLGAGIRMFAMSSTIFLIPLYLADIQGLNVVWIGLVIMLHAGALLATTRQGGQLADRWGGRWPVVIGLAMQGGFMLYFALLPGAASLGLVLVGLIGHGLGSGISQAALHRSAMSRIPQAQTGVAAGLYSMIRFGGIALGVALGGVLLQQGLDWSLDLVGAYKLVFCFIGGVALAGIAIGWGLQE